MQRSIVGLILCICIIVVSSLVCLYLRMILFIFIILPLVSKATSHNRAGAAILVSKPMFLPLTSSGMIGSTISLLVHRRANLQGIFQC